MPAVSVEELEERILILKDWNRYKTNQHRETIKLIDRYMFCQQKALDELRVESEELYQAAIQVNYIFFFVINNLCIYLLRKQF